jgi:hypothetical protein
MSAARWVALWAGMLALLCAVMALFGDIGRIAPLLLGGAALGVLVLALVAALAGQRGGAERFVPDSSLATVGVAFGVALLVGGAEVGPWMLGIGAGVLALGLAGLVREQRAERRAR